ncbi:unnamed protein product [Caenorhabditis nigoni]
MKKLIKSSQMGRFRMMDSIEYDSDGIEQPWIHAFYRHKSFLQMNTFESEDAKYEYFQLNVSGKTINFRISDREYILPVAVFDLCDIEVVIKSIHSYLIDFFGESVQYNWKAEDTEKESEELFIPYIPKFNNVSFSINLFLEDEFAGMKKLENFFASNPVFKCIDITVMTTTEPFNPESKFYQAESIRTEQEELSCPDILRHFQGRQATVTCEKGELFDLIVLVNRWKSGEAFQKMEYLEFRKLSGVFLPNQNKVLNEIAAKHIDPTKKPPTHTLPKVYDGYCSPYLSNTYPIVSHTYVVRESDNRVASVQIEQNTLRFGVWDKTEEEFLRMMD